MRSPSALPLLAVLLLLPFADPFSGAMGFGLDILGLQNEDFFQPSPVANVRVSPSGKRVAYTRNKYNREDIHILDVETGSERVRSTGHQAGGPVTYIDWLDEAHILFQTEHGDIFRQDVNSGISVQQFDSDRVLYFRNAIAISNVTLPRVISTLPKDPERILLSAYDSEGVRRVYRLPIVDGDRESLPEPLHKHYKDFDLWHADHDGEVRLATKLRQKGVALHLRQGDSSKWIPLDSLLSGSEAKLDVELTKSNVTQPRDFLLGFDFDTSRFYFASNKLTDTTAVYLYDIDEGKVVEQVAHDPIYDLVDTATGQSHPIFSEKRRQWVGIHYNAETPATFWFHESYRKLQAKIDEKLPNSSNLILDWSDDESRLVVSALWSQRPHAYYLYEADSDALSPIGSDDHPLARKPGVASRSVSFTGRTGHALHGYFTPGKTENGETAPLVMLVHGGPWARDSFTYDPFVQCLAHNGYSTLRVNFRGSTGYGYSHFSAAAKNYGWAVQEDIIDAREWAISQGLASADRVAIMGFSFGGYASALAAAAHPEAFQCAVPISGIYDLVYETKQIRKERGRGVTYEHWKQMVGSDWKDRKRLEEISPLNLADRIRIPLLIAHGTLDPVAKIDHARRFIEQLEKSDRPHEFIELKEEAHSLDLPKNQAYLFDEIVGFLDKHM